MAKATKKSVLLAVVVVLCALLLVAVYLGRVAAQPEALAETWDDLATEPVGMAGSGSQADPYLITSANDLARMSVWVNSGEYADKHYALTNDIDLSGYAFTPIGNPASPFAGTFDGQNFKISGLKVEAQGTEGGEYCLGLFGAVSSGAQIKSLGLNGGDISFTSDEKIASLHVGGIAGVNGGRIENVYSYVNINITVNGYTAKAAAGGIAGRNEANCDIAGSLFAGEIAVSGALDAVGGISGDNYGRIQNTYNAGEISVEDPSGSTFAGGIAGITRIGSDTAFSVNGGPVISAKAGGVAGYRESETMVIRYSYYSSDLSLTQSAVFGENDIDGGTNRVRGFTSEQLHNATLTSLNLSGGVWARYSSAFDGGRYFAPYITAIDAIDPALSRGAVALRVYGFDRAKLADISVYGLSQNPYLLENATHFTRLAQFVNSGTAYTGRYFMAVGDPQGYLDLSGFESTIGTKGLSGGDKPFDGLFDGNFTIIRNFGLDRRSAITDDQKRYLGLFGFVGTNGFIRNVTLDTDCYVYAKESSGSLVGYNMGQLENIESRAEVRGNAWIGGIVGYNHSEGKMYDILSLVTLQGNAEASHIYGVVGDGYITNSRNVWYVAPYTQGTVIATGGRGRALIVDIPGAQKIKDTSSDPRGIIVYGATGDSGFHGLKATKNANGSMRFEGRVDDPVSQWSIEYRLANETVIQSSMIYSPGSDETNYNETVYARLVKTVLANDFGSPASELYFSKQGSSYTTQAKLYKGQNAVLYSEIPEGSYFYGAYALIEAGEGINNDYEFPFTYSYSDSENRLSIRFVMSEDLYQVNPDIRHINAPDIDTKIYDGTPSLYMSGQPYAVNIPGFSVTYAYSVAGGAPRNVGNYYLTVNVRSADGVFRGRENKPYSIIPKSISIDEDMLTRVKEYDGSLNPVNAPVINQHLIEEIIPADRGLVIVTSLATYQSTEIGFALADFTFTLTGPAAANYSTPADIVNVLCEIVKRELVIEIQESSLTYVYNGLAAEVSYFGFKQGRAPLFDLVPQLDIYFSQDIVGTRIEAKNVGEYDVNVRFIETTHNNKPITYYYTIRLDKEYKFNIVPMPVNIEFGDYEGLVYNGQPQTIKAFYNDENGERREVPESSFSYAMIPGTGDYSAPDMLKNAGSYTVTVTLPVGGNYVATTSTNTKIVQMAKASQPAITITPLAGPFVYGDAPRLLSLDGAAADSTGEVVYTVLSGNAVIIDGDKLEFTGGGEVFLSAVKAADPNYHAAATPNYRIEVAKATIKIGLADIEKVYGDTLGTLEFIFVGWADRDIGKSVPDGFAAPTVRIVGEGVNETLNRLKKYNAGVYTLEVANDASSLGYDFDYSLLTPSPVYTVLPKQVILRPDDMEQTYGLADSEGNPASLRLTYTVYSSDGEPLSVALNGIVLSKEAGYVVLPDNGYYEIFCADEEAARAQNPNYSITFETGKYYIRPKTLYISAVPQTKTYGDPDPEPRFEVSGLAYNDEVSEVVFARDPAKPILDREAGQNAYYRYSDERGVYFYSASNIRLSINYTLVFIENTLTIYKAVPEMVSQGELNVPYGNTIGTISPSAQFKVTIGGRLETINGTLAWVNPSARPTFDGDNRFAARFTPAPQGERVGNIAAITVYLTVNIFKRPVELTFETLDFTYTGRVQSLRYTVSNILEGDELGDEITYSATFKDAGSYTVTISIANGNYTLIDFDGDETDALELEIVIKKAPLLIYLEDIELGQDITPPKNFIYEGFVNGEDEDDLDVKPDVTFQTEPGNHIIKPFGAQAKNYEITYKESRQSVTKTRLESPVQKFTINGNFDFMSEITVTELTKSANRGLFAELAELLAPIKSMNKLGDVQISRLYAIDITIEGEKATLKGVNRASIEIPPRLRESRKFAVVLISEDGSMMRLAQNVDRIGNTLYFDIEDCSMVGIVNPPDYTFVILGCVVVVLVIAVFTLDIVSERLGIGRHKKKKASKQGNQK